MHRLVLTVALFAGAAWCGAETIPPAPARYFNDYAGIVPAATGDELNRQLEQYERASSNQLVVAIFPTMESGSSVEDYTVRIAHAWKVGQAGKNNGAVLFAFMREHKLYIQVGYGLEATLTDAISSQIIQDELKPAFRAGRYDAGLRAAVASMIAATKGEYHGNGRTRADDRSSGSHSPVSTLVVIFVIVVVVINVIRQARNPRVYMNPRRGGGGIFWSSGGSGGGWSGGGGSSSDSGGSFSGGGGSFGGGGAGGSW